LDCARQQDRPIFWRSAPGLDCATQHDHHAVGGRADPTDGFAGREITNSGAGEKCFYFPTLDVAKQHAFAERLKGLIHDETPFEAAAAA
jgi:hypothetical protein